MTSVWKRLQRVGKNASKFQFSASYQSLTVECVRNGRWQPNKLIVVWTRRKRRKTTKPQSWQPGISNPFRGVLVWPESVSVEVVVTLYKESRPDSMFEDKEWMFVIEDESVTGRRKPIASASINMADYSSACSESVDVSLHMKILSKKVLSATLDLQLSCVLLKEGKATDEDMMSIASMMSMSNDIGCLQDFDDESEESLALRLGNTRKFKHNGFFTPALKSKEEGGSDSNTSSPIVPVRRKHSRSKSLTTPTKDRSTRRDSTGSENSGGTESSQEPAKERSHAEDGLIEWCKSCTRGYSGVNIKNMTTSFTDGLAICAILHHFHPELIDFDSLEKTNIQGNNKMAFDLFSNLGVPRLLDPTYMMFSKIPDKLAVMTYLFQVRTLMITHSKGKPAPLERPKPSLQTATGNVVINPFLDDVVEKPDEESDEPLPYKNQFNVSALTSQGEDSSPFYEDEDVKSSTETAPVGQPSPFGEDEDQSESKTKIRTTKAENSLINSCEDDLQVSASLEREQSYPEELNPFDEDNHWEETESNEGNTKPEKGSLNPFEEDEADDDRGAQVGARLEEEQSYPKGLNPFDEEDDCVETETKKRTRQPEKGLIKGETEEQGIEIDCRLEKRESYPDDLNPFGSDSSSEDISLRTNTFVDTDQNGKKQTVSPAPGCNPFEDDSVSERVSDPDSPSKREGGAAKNNTIKVSERYAVSRTITKHSGHAGDEIKVSAGAEEENPWTTRLPEKANSRHRRQTHTTHTKVEPTHGTQSKRPAPRRPAPRPPGKALGLKDSECNGSGTPCGVDVVLDPVGKECKETTPRKEDQAADVVLDPVGKECKETTPRKEDQAADVVLDPVGKECKETTLRKEDQAADVVLDPVGKECKETTPRKEDQAADVVLDPVGKKCKETTPRKEDQAADVELAQSLEMEPDNSDVDTKNKLQVAPDGKEATRSAEKDDIKQRAHQLLMEARKKAGASSSLPRERLAEIKVRSLRRESSFTQDTNENEENEHLETDENEAAANEKSATPDEKPRSIQDGRTNLEVNNIEAKVAKEDPTRAKKKEDDESVAESKAVSKATDSRPVKPGARERRRAPTPPSTVRQGGGKPGTEAKTSDHDGKAGFEESEELRRIRSILDQGKEIKANKRESSNKSTSMPSRQVSSSKTESGRSPEQQEMACGDGGSPSSSPSGKKYGLGHAAAAKAYAQSRRMNFDSTEVKAPIPRATTLTNSPSPSDGSDTKSTTPAMPPPKPPRLFIADDGEQSEEAPEDKGLLIREELNALEEEQEALDKVAGKLEKELRIAMASKGCKEEEEKLTLEWFILINKKNDLINKQTELGFMEKKYILEQRIEQLDSELRMLMEKEASKQTEVDKKREDTLLRELVALVNQKDQLVRLEDSTSSPAELDVKDILGNARTTREKNECVVQ